MRYFQSFMLTKIMALCGMMLLVPVSVQSGVQQIAEQYLLDRQESHRPEGVQFITFNYLRTMVDKRNHSHVRFQVKYEGIPIFY